MTKKEKITRNELVELNNSIIKAMDDKNIGLYVSYVLDENVVRFQKLLQRVQNSANSNAQFKEYNKERKALARKYARKDSKGRPAYVPKTREYDISDIGHFEEEMEPITEKYKNVQIDKVMEGIIEVSITKISVKEFPLNFNMSGLRPIIKETNEEIEKYLSENKSE